MVSIVKNPFGVGESGTDMVPIAAHCECCDLLFQYKTPRHAPRGKKRCTNCTRHLLDGSLEEQIIALREHEPRLRSWLNDVYDKANEQEKTIKKQREQLHEKGQQVAEALQTRDRHQLIATAVLSNHGQKSPGRCRCGQPHPCVSTRAAEEADRRLAVYLRRRRMPDWYDDFAPNQPHCESCTCYDDAPEVDGEEAIAARGVPARVARRSGSVRSTRI